MWASCLLPGAALHIRKLTATTIEKKENPLLQLSAIRKLVRSTPKAIVWWLTTTCGMSTCLSNGAKGALTR